MNIDVYRFHHAWKGERRKEKGERTDDEDMSHSALFGHLDSGHRYY